MEHEVTELPVRMIVHGRALVVRAAVAEDVDRLLALYLRLGPDDRYRRFFASRQPARSFAERWLAVTDRGGVVLVAQLDDGDVVAEAGFAVLAPDTAELAVTLDPAWRGWLGPYLVELLVQQARARGIRVLEAEVLGTNCSMLATLRARGCAFMPVDDAANVRVAIGTDRAAPAWPAGSKHPRVLIEGASPRYSGAVAAAHAGMSVRVCPGPERSRAHPCPLLHGDHCPLVDDADAVVVVALGLDESTRDALLRAHQQAGDRAVLRVENSAGSAAVVDAVRSAFPDE